MLLAMIPRLLMKNPATARAKKLYIEQMEQSNYGDDLQGEEEHKASHLRKNNNHSLLLPNNKGENHQTIQLPATTAPATKKLLDSVEHSIIEIRNNETAAAAAPHLLHVIWGRPPPTDKGFAGKERVLDNSTFTGCCDVMIELALRSYIAILPTDFTILFWNTGGWDAVKYLEHIGLNSTNIKPVNFDSNVELKRDKNLREVYQGLENVVPTSDFVRYVVMRNYGGTYVDLDGVMVRPPPLADGIPRINLSPTKMDGHISCSGEGTKREPGTCILSNSFFVGFPKNHTVFNIILKTIDTEKRTCGGKSYFCFGPQWYTKELMKAGISDIRDIGVLASPLLRNGGAYKREETVAVSHFDFDVGDMKCDKNNLLKEMCKRFNMTSARYNSQEEIHKSGETKSSEKQPQEQGDVMSMSDNDPLTAKVNEILFSVPSLFLGLARNSKQCDTSRQKSWEVAVSSRYSKGELNDTCIAPKEGLDNYYGPSGPGSSLKATKDLREKLPIIFQELNVKTFMHAPCGDWLWMQTVNMTGVQYFGGDITNSTVNRNRGCFGAENIHFHWFDITCMVPPPVDLILVRDILFHLPETLVMEVLANINKSGARFLATVTFTEGENGNWKSNMAYQDTLGARKKMGLDSHIGFQRLNLYASPFHFPPPLYAAGGPEGRHVGVWKLPMKLE